MGSLYGVLEQRRLEKKQSSIAEWPVLGIRMTYLIIFQVSEEWERVSAVGNKKTISSKKSKKLLTLAKKCHSRMLN